MPGNRYEDLYIAAVLIALAQELRLCEEGSDDINKNPIVRPGLPPL
jgi:hypothetical protein